jgi:hypothetical protein
MADDLERDIFESGSEAPAAPPAVDDAAAVRESIREMQREPGREGPSAPRETPTPPQPQPQHGVDDQSPAGLLKALLDERGTRQGLEGQLRRYQEQEREVQRRAKENEVPFDQRFFSQPQQELETYVAEKLSPVEQRMQNFMTDIDMRFARQTYGEPFDEAFKAWFEQVGDLSRPDPQTYFAVMNAPSPGEAIMAWHNDRRTRSEIGDGGIDGFRARVEQEILAKYGLSAQAPPATNGGPHQERARQEDGRFTPRHEVRLPSSLSRMGAAGRGKPDAEEDGSEAAIFDSGRPERRR